MFELTPELYEYKEKIEDLAKRVYGLDTFDVEFCLIPSKLLNQIASRIGFPRRFCHWTHGLEYEKLKKRYDWGLGKIYELVINNDPAYAYLMQNNSITEQKLVMAHVYGHCAVFKNNLYFSKTRRDMIDVIANNASRIDDYSRRYGESEVESFIDACMSIQDRIDCYTPFANKSVKAPRNKETEDLQDPVPPKVRCDKHLDMFVNPQKELDKKKEQMKKKLNQQPWFPEKPEKDLLLFLLQYAPLKKWQEDILSIIREESYYFNPQRQTKILNEGFASYFHHRMMVEHLLEPHEVVDFSRDHASTLQRNPYYMNPYFLGYSLLVDIEKRWNRGRFGQEYENCTNYLEKKNWNTNVGLGYEKLMEVMVVDNDYSLVDKYLTHEFCEENQLYKYEFNKESGMYEIGSREFADIKSSLLDDLSNSGIPYIVVADGNFKNRNELLLIHKHEFDLDLKMAHDTAKSIHKIWKRPVHLLTKHNGKHFIVSYGSELQLGDKDLEDFAKQVYVANSSRI